MLQNKKFPLIFGIIYCFICLFMGASYVLSGSIKFDADISRDFLLLDELATRKVIFIGPRASGIPGVFHGPLWIYLNYPAYILSGKNPVAVGWFWVVLAASFLVSSYFVVKKITTQKTALIFVLLLSGMLVPWLHQLLNPFGALMMMPFVVFAVTKYQQTKNSIYWILLLFLLGMMIQFQMAVGVPITILVFIWLLVWMYKEKRLLHLLFLPLLLIPLASFLIFDFRHDFAQLRSVIAFVSDKSDVPTISYVERVIQRFWMASKVGINLFSSNDLNGLNFGVFMIFALQMMGSIQLLNNSSQKMMKFLFYLYVGYYVITLLFNGYLLVQYWWPLVPLAYLMIALFLSAAPRKLFIPVLVVILGFQLIEGLHFVKINAEKIGLIEDDWLFQKKLTTSLFEGDENEFGYFIFTPDIYAYESKAAMTYAISQHPEKNVGRYQKKPVTYMIIAPDPSFRIDIKSANWKKDRVRLVATPSAALSFPDGYTVEKYDLTPEQLKILPDSTIDDWLHFR